MGHEINHKFPELEAYTKKIVGVTHEINNSGHFNSKEKRDAISVLEGLKLRKSAEIIDRLYKRPVDTDDVHTKDESLPLADSIKNSISKNRPKGYHGDNTPKHE